MKTNLTQAITIHSAYGVEVEYENREIWKIDPTVTIYAMDDKLVGVSMVINDIQQGKAKLLLHSLDKLTQEIDGKLGIVELARIATKIQGDWDVLLYDQGLVAVCDGFSFWYINGSFYTDKNGENIETNCQLELFNYLLTNHYNIFGLSSEFVKEKAI